MNVKSTFLNGELEEEVYIEQSKGFQLLENADYVCKLKKALLLGMCYIICTSISV
jgi:hypothetical protein